MKELEIKVNTVFITVGPTGCGKSHFSTKHLYPFLKERGYNVQYISSDEIRRQVLGANLDRYDQKMVHASKVAFNMLENTFKNVIQFPVSAEFVIIDTQGLSEEFRNSIQRVAKENRYNTDLLVFDYKDNSQYLEYTREEDKKIVRGKVKTLKEKVLKTLNKKHFGIHRISSNKFDEVSFKVIDEVEYAETKLDKRFDWTVIGDIHGYKEEFVELLESHGCVFDEEGKITMDENNKNKLFILVGDLIDKGPDSKGVLEIVDKNKELFFLVKGNHENFAHKLLTGEIKYEDHSEELLDTFLDFGKKMYIEKDQELIDLFNRVFSRMKESYSTDDFVVTHAPCKNVYLNKIDNVSKGKQRTFYYDKPSGTVEENELYMRETFQFIREDSEYNHPLHIFGHVPLKRVCKQFNKIFLDTGLEKGGKLTSVTITQNEHNGTYVYFKDVKSRKESTDTLYTLTLNPPKVFNFDDLEWYDALRIKRTTANKVNYISGTVSPADKLDEELESLEAGLSFYKEKGENKVVLQPKYMGSRCQVYLFKELEECYATSRNGYLIDFIDLSDVFKKLIEKHSKYFSTGTKMLLLDGELLPWNAIGRGLIDSQFKPHIPSVKTEIDLLRSTGFEEKLQKEIDVLNEKWKEELRLPKTEFIEKHNHNSYSKWKSLLEFLPEWMNTEQQEEKIAIYEKQIALYGEDGPIEFAGFSLLKKVNLDDTEEFFFDDTTEDNFRRVSDDNIHVVDFSDPDYLAKAQAFYDGITLERGMEGIVIKPEMCWKDGVPQYIKVRNKDYLTIIYGYDYTFKTKYDRLLKRKRIINKMRTSQKESWIGKMMLMIPYNEITIDNIEYLEVIHKMIKEEQYEKTIDPRL